MQPIRRTRWWTTIVAAASLTAPGLGAVGTAMAVPDAADVGAAEKIDGEVSAQVEDEGRADVWVRLAERPDLDQFSTISDWEDRGQAVVDALTATAESSQKEIRATLDEEGVSYEAFWATNSIRVGGADAEMITSLAANGAVEGIYPTMQIEPPELEEAEPHMAPAAVEWGVNDIKAPQVWDTYGAHGEGIVVASIDTGVQYDHPALVNQYRGNNGDGTFDHNYNWFNASGGSPDAPSDHDGHGSHVTGTMVGSDGGDNQIGVAPGATWISADGCCPSDAALIASGEWMLAPTDLEGQNPDVSKRPHVINNSWGTTAPSNAPFMEDVIEAWAASGQFGVFANGNNGPGCQTSGSPGSRTVTYSVGNYNSSHTISSSSSKGAGQDGTIKPNIAAPGSAVRSSVPGNGYASYSGTSMASPHVAGAVALVWSAAPALVGDVEGTRALLNGSATDTENLQCGGTAENNNVFGEGRLDALALVAGAPIGETGTLTGVVTSSGDPLSGVDVAVVGPIDRQLVTNSEGAYNALLSAGDYELTFSKFGYLPHTATATITPETTTTVNAALEPAPSETVTGTVTDGSGYGFPLYAKISADGTPVATFTDPETGEYSLDLPVGSTYTLTVEVQYPGYTTPSIEVAPGDGTHDVAVPVEVNTCIAPGYGFDVEGVTETFDGTTMPEGWAVEDHAGTGQVWLFDNPDGRDNLTGGEGNFAIMDSDYHGSGGVQDTSLVSPSTDLSTLTNPVVGFKQDWRPLGDNADVDLSLDGGETWTTVLAQTVSDRGPVEKVVPLPAAAGQADVKVRFHQYNSDWDWWWMVDDVFLGNRDCAPTGEGGYVVGNVSGVETGAGVVGGVVTNLDVPEERAVTTATPADENLEDGFYWIFSSNPGTHPFEAAARTFESATQDVSVTHAATVRADFELGSGFVVVDPAGITTTQGLGTTSTSTLTFGNTGSGAAEVELSEVPGEVTILGADGTERTVTGLDAGDGGEVVTRDVETSFAVGGADLGVQGAEDAQRVAADPWVSLADYPKVVMDNRVVSLDGTWYSIGGTNGTASFGDVYRYDAEAMTWTAVAPLPTAASAVTAAVVNGQLVVSGGWVAGGVSTDTFLYDPAADAWTEAASAPAGVSAAGTAVLDGKVYSVGGCTSSDCTPMADGVMAYDVAADSWEQVADYPATVAFASCGGVDGQIVCTGGNTGSAALADAYAYDPGTDVWAPLPDAPIDTWASSYATANGQLVVNGGVQGGDVSNATFAYDPASGSWVDLPASGVGVYRGGAACGIAKVGGSTGGFTPIVDAEHLPGYGDCGSSGADVGWLTVDPVEFTVPAGETVEVTVTTDANVAQPGTYTAAIKVRTNTPQRIDDVPVTMNVTPPRGWGKLVGTVTGVATDGTVAPLEGATVDVSSRRGVVEGVTLTTDADGRYAWWISSDRGGLFDLIAFKDGYRPQSKAAQVKKGATTTVDFGLTQLP